MIGPPALPRRSPLSRCSSEASVVSIADEAAAHAAEAPVERLAVLKFTQSPRGPRRSGGAIPPATSISRIQEDTENNSDDSSSGSDRRAYSTGSREPLLRAGRAPKTFDLERTPQAFLLTNKNRRTNHTRCCRCIACARPFYDDQEQPILAFWDTPACVINCRCIFCFELCPHEGHTLPAGERCHGGDRHCLCRAGCDDPSCVRCLDRVGSLSMSVPSRTTSSRSSIPTETEASDIRSSFEGRSGHSSGEYRGELRGVRRRSTDARSSWERPRSPDRSRSGLGPPGARGRGDSFARHATAAPKKRP